MRVQAKVIHQDVDKFKELHRSYKDEITKEKIYQSDILISNAQTEYFPCIPIYCLYSHWTSLTSYKELLPMWVSHLDSHNFGCSIIKADEVQHIRKVTPTGSAHKCGLKDTLTYSIPLAGLVCSPFVADGSIAERAQDVLQADKEYLLPFPPPYVIDLIERRSRQPLKNIERDFSVEVDLPTGIIGVLAIQQQGGDK